MIDDYKIMWEDFAEKKAKGYLVDRFDPSSATGFKNFVREALLLCLLNPRPGEKILDVGCASGKQVFLIAEKGAYAVGTDISEKFMEEARNYTRENNVANVSFDVLDIKDLKFPDKQFDKILCAEVLEHVVDLEASINELLRVLKPGGLLVLSVPNKNGDGTLWGRIRNALTGKKFKPLEDFSLKAVEEHGDAHVREFDHKSMTEFLEEHKLDIVNLGGCCILDWPLYNLTLNALLRFKLIRQILYRVELTLCNIRLLNLFSRHLVVTVKKGS